LACTYLAPPTSRYGDLVISLLMNSLDSMDHNT
jgi:hypothetical protein